MPVCACVCTCTHIISYANSLLEKMVQSRVWLSDSITFRPSALDFPKPSMPIPELASLPAPLNGLRERNFKSLWASQLPAFQALFLAIAVSINFLQGVI